MEQYQKSSVAYKYDVSFLFKEYDVDAIRPGYGFL